MEAHTKSLHVSVSNADELIWEGGALSVSSENQEGPFDILPGHANFITMIEGKPITIRTDSGESKDCTYPNAVIYVLGDTVKIYVNI